jgi:hypothetical protein
MLNVSWPIHPCFRFDQETQVLCGPSIWASRRALTSIRSSHAKPGCELSHVVESLGWLEEGRHNVNRRQRISSSTTRSVRPHPRLTPHRNRSNIHIMVYKACPISPRFKSIQVHFALTSADLILHGRASVSSSEPRCRGWLCAGCWPHPDTKFLIHMPQWQTY